LPQGHHAASEGHHNDLSLYVLETNRKKLRRKVQLDLERIFRQVYTV
jgi:hypothetical protein